MYQLLKSLIDRFCKLLYFRTVKQEKKLFETTFKIFILKRLKRMFEFFFAFRTVEAYLLNFQ